MMKVDKLADSIHVNMTISDDERLDLLDETDDEDPTFTLPANSKGKQVLIWAAKPEKKKFVPKNKIVAPYVPRVPQPSGSQPAQSRLRRQPVTPTSPSKHPVHHRLTGKKFMPYKRVQPQLKPTLTTPPPTLPNLSLPPPLPSMVNYFPTPPPPKPAFTDFMISSLTNVILMHSKDNFNIKFSRMRPKISSALQKKEYTT